MARLLHVSTTGYYAYVKRRAATVLTDRQQRRADLEAKIVTVHRESHGTYGSPRITGELRDRGERVSAKTVAKIMAQIGVEGARRFDQGRPDAVWTTDITYLTCGQGDMFLCAIRDGHTRKVLAYSLADHIGADMVTTAIDAAVAVRGGRCAGTILHSDRGGEVTAHLTARACRRHELQRSMGATGICWDNSPSESLWSSFKHEQYYRHTYATKAELVVSVDKWMNFYNTTRRHSAIGNQSPDNYERSLRTTAA
jgi:transposase InsO family protein